MNLKKNFSINIFALQLVFGLLMINSAQSEEAELPEVVIAAPTPEFKNTTGELPGTLTVPNNSEATKIIQRTPGGVYVVGAERFEDKYSLNFQDTVSHVPGVYATKRFAEEVRISIRGSGIERNFHQKGLVGFQDGVPFGAADGSGDFQEIDTLAIQRIEIHKGGNAMQYGSATLGGSINMISKTGHSNPGNQLSYEMGSDDTFRGNLQSGRIFDNGSDLFLSLSGTSSDGFREHTDQKNVKFNSNAGVKISDNVESRFYFSANYINLELPNTVTLSQALDNPRQAKSSALTDDEHRDIISYRAANKTTFDLGGTHKMDVGAFAFWKELNHPITSFVGVIGQESVNYGLYTQNSGSYKLGGHLNRYRFGTTSHLGTTDAKVWENNNGNAGVLTADAQQNAQNVVVYGENSFYINPKLALVSTLQYVWSNRDIFDNFTPTDTDSSIYESWNPKIGFLYKPMKKVQVFGNISKSFEPPDFADLTQGSTSGFIDLKAQQAWTVEIGTRGEQGPVAWDISLYRAWIRDELLKFTTGGGVPATGFNGEDTIHQGAEVGLGFRLAKNIMTPGDSLKWWNAYTYSDFFFNGNPEFEDNSIPGQPPHFYNTELRYDHPDKWFVSTNVLAASEADVDFNNTFTAPGYAIVGVGAGVEIKKNVNLFFEGRNLLNNKYISNFSTAVTATSTSNLFYAGDLRRFFGGMRIKF